MLRRVQVMQLSSSPLAGVKELRIHMLGAVSLPRGGLPTLPSLTHLEFYLPDERNWGMCARCIWLRVCAKAQCGLHG